MTTMTKMRMMEEEKKDKLEKEKEREKTVNFALHFFLETPLPPNKTAFKAWIF